ncbi:MAG: DoxX family protein [candidate division Zixibacteria bacterium]|nr:DoxX family protein [candidate division Zixibacteria bacterium]
MVRRVLFRLTPAGSWADEAAMTLLRVFAGLALALAHGLGKLPPGEAFVKGVSELGFPAPEFFAWAAALSEFGGGLLLALGLLTRPAAFLIVCTMLTAGFGRHAADPFAVKERALLFLVIALVFLIRGAGRWGADRLFAPPVK